MLNLKKDKKEEQILPQAVVQTGQCILHVILDRIDGNVKFCGDFLVFFPFETAFAEHTSAVFGQSRDSPPHRLLQFLYQQTAQGIIVRTDVTFGKGLFPFLPTLEGRKSDLGPFTAGREIVQTMIADRLYQITAQGHPYLQRLANLPQNGK